MSKLNGKLQVGKYSVAGAVRPRAARDSECGHAAPFATAGIAQIHAVIEAAADDTSIWKLGPIAAAHYSSVAGAHIKPAIGVAAEREFFFEPEHDVSEAVLSEKGL